MDESIALLSAFADLQKVFVNEENDEKMPNRLLGRGAQHLVPSRNPFSR